MWVMRTSGRSSSGRWQNGARCSGSRSPSIRCSLFTTAVIPEPWVMITSSGPAWTCALRSAWACWYARVIAMPVALDSVWVFPTSGPNSSSSRRSMGP